MAANHSPSSLAYPTPSVAGLKAQWVGKAIEELDCPAAIVDIATIKRNCDAMLATVDKLGTDFRAHVKTYCSPLILLGYTLTSSPVTRFLRTDPLTRH